VEEERLLTMVWWALVVGLILGFVGLVPLAMKWELNMRVSVPASCLIGLSSGAIVVGMMRFWDLSGFDVVILEMFVIGVLSMSLLLWRFYRDPERTPCDDQNTILSPADGKIIYVKKFEGDQLPCSEKDGRILRLSDFIQTDLFRSGGHLIGIAMNYLDVHVNRAPTAGRVYLMKRIEGSFISLKKPTAILQNERLLTVIDNGTFKVGVVQIASRLVRRIVSYIQEGQDIHPGERIGMIRFGSQVDLLIPHVASIRICVKTGESVKAGISVMARFVYD
jgi:phosphatidylserine decarboxylase